MNSFKFFGYIYIFILSKKDSWTFEHLEPNAEAFTIFDPGQDFTPKFSFLSRK